MSVQTVFRTDRAAEWTPERIGRMTVQEIKQLRENAERLNEPEIVQRCSEALKAVRPRARANGRPRTSPRTRARHLVARAKAFEARGVYLVDPRTSWGGVRKHDGAIVIALWADAIVSSGGACRCLLWAPNVDGSRPWSETSAGLERLSHCKRAMELGGAEGLLVYGQALDGHLPEDKAQAVHGADPEVLLAVQVERVDAQYWAVWGKKKPAAPIPQP